MKQYLLFAYQGYYPYGGWNDFKNDFDTIEEAIEAGKSLTIGDAKFFDIVDITKKTIVESWRNSCESGWAKE